MAARQVVLGSNEHIKVAVFFGGPKAFSRVKVHDFPETVPAAGGVYRLTGRTDSFDDGTKKGGFYTFEAAR